MALFYKRIKGCGVTGTDTAVAYDKRLTYITFSNAENTYVNYNTSNFISLDYLPILSRSDETNSNEVTFGHLLTSQMDSPVISFSNTWTFNVYDAKGNSKKIVSFDYDGMSMAEDSAFKGNTTFSEGSTTFKHGVVIENNSLTVKATESGKTCYIEAPYFNATSDIRAKENIQPLTINCLPIVKNLPIYSFDYKFDGSHSVGVIAQEAEKIQLGDFNLVNDNDSNGIDRFKTVKETKLTYVLWKAVQELSEEVEQLKAELAQLKEGR